MSSFDVFWGKKIFGHFLKKKMVAYLQSFSLGYSGISSFTKVVLYYYKLLYKMSFQILTHSANEWRIFIRCFSLWKMAK